MIKHITVATHLKVRRMEFCSKILYVAKIHFRLSYFSGRVFYTESILHNEATNILKEERGKNEPQLNTLLWQHNFKMRQTKKNGTVDFVRHTNKFCCYSNTPKCGHAILTFSRLLKKNPFIVSNLTTWKCRTTENVTQILSVAKMAFWMWPK